MITIDKINRSEALRYMGYKKDMDIKNTEHILDKCEKELLSVIKPRFCYRIFDIDKKGDPLSFKGCKLTLEGNDIAAHLRGCDKAVIMAATLSSDTDKLINRYKVRDMTSAFILDCMASAAIEQVCDMAQSEIIKAHHIKNITWRFSPGYGDLSIKLQREMIACLNGERLIGLTATENNILMPRKSVTAIMGISDNEIPKGKRGCAICSMANVCQYRKRGDHCGL